MVDTQRTVLAIFTLGYNHAPPTSMYSCWTTSSIWVGLHVGLWEARWTNRRITEHVGHNVSVVCHCFQQRSVEHSHTCRPGSGWPHSTNAHQDQRIAWAAAVAQTGFREEIRAHVAPAVSPRTIANSLLVARLRSRVSLARLPLTSQHCQAWLL